VKYGTLLLALGFAGAIPLGMAFSLGACSESVGQPNAGGSSSGDAGPDADPLSTGTEIQVPTSEGARVYVKLSSPPAIVTPADPKNSKDWDIAFQGADAFTNSGVSGSGQGAAFGPIDPVVFFDDKAPDVPFTSIDRTGGAFVRWWFYDGSTHGLYSRFHVYGVKDGAKQWKVQVEGYYTERDGTAVSALYQVRWAEVTDTGSGPLQEVKGLDGTAGGTAGGPQAPVECLDLGTGARTMLSDSAAHASSAWHLCFRREDISVNGDQGGPRGVTATDFDIANVATEKLADVQKKTPDSEKAHFDAVQAKDFVGPTFRGDGVVTAFTQLWTVRGSNPLTPRQDAWYVVGADGKSKYLVGFPRFEGATATSVGKVVMRVKTVK
jgi:hypothetical protein